MDATFFDVLPSKLIETVSPSWYNLSNQSIFCKFMEGNDMSNENKLRGRVTIPTDVDVVPQTLELFARWGADAIRDCDGTDFPAELKAVDAKVYSTY